MTDDSGVSPESLSEYVDYADSIIERYPQMDEENTKWKLIREFLNRLGWDVAFDAELEYSISIGNSSTYHVDYALFSSSSTLLLFVETKGYDTALTEDHRGQLYSYLRQTDVNWGLLTNGRSYEIYRREIVDNGVQIRTVERLKLEELPLYADLVRLLSKKGLESGESQENFERIRDVRGAKRTLREEKETIAEDLAHTLTDAAGEVVSQEAKTEAKELIDRLVQTLETSAEERSHQTEVDGDDTERDSHSFWNEIEDELGIRRTDESVELVDDHTAKDNFVAFVSYLFENSYLTDEDVPFGTGRKRYVLNSEKKHKDGGSMYAPEEVRDGIYLETHSNTLQKKRRIVELGEIARDRSETDE